MKYSHKDFKNMMDELFRKYSSKTIITYLKDDGSKVLFTFDDIHNIIIHLFKTLISCGILAGDRAAIVTPHSPYGVIAELILAYLNITIVPIDASLPIEEINKLLEFSDVRTIFTTDEFKNRLDVNLISKIPCFKLDGNNYPIELFDDSISKSELPTTPDKDNDVIAIIFSSGTTGEMKGVMITYHSTIRMIEVCTTLSSVKDNMTNLCVLPFNHIGGMSNAFTYLFNGCECAFIENINPSKLQKGLHIFKPHFFVMVPKVFEVFEQKIKSEIQNKNILTQITINFLLNICGFFRRYLGINIGRAIFKKIASSALGDNIYGLGVGASPCKPETEKFFLNVGLKWANLYASTETNVPITSTDVYDKYPIGTVGNVKRHDGINILIDAKDSSGIGEILVKTDLIMKGYFKRPDLTEKVFDENGYFKTGDYGYIDKKGYLHLTGRIKESIVLKNGKKVSPSDIDEYYLSKTENLELASRGVPNMENYDEIHIFVEDKNYSTADKMVIYNELQQISISAPSMYKTENIHFIDNIPKTSIGKVKRFCLSPENEIKFDNMNTTDDSESNTDKLINIIKHHSTCDRISLSCDLKNDLGVDSLGMFEIISEIESEYKIDLSAQLGNIQTVDDLKNSIFHYSKLNNKSTAPFNVKEFPIQKSNHDLTLLRNVMALSKAIWNFKINGIENIPKNGHYIICPNHESHLDGLWVFTAIGESRLNLNNICCMAKKEHLENSFSRKWLRLLGGIPVDRYVNPLDSIKRCIECVNEGNILLIHPEGTRTRNGKLGVFKEGAAKIAIEANCLIIPVCINGAREIYPPDRNLPHIFNLLNMKKYTLEIEFGKPIAPEGKIPKEITNEIQEFIVKSKTKYTEKVK